MHDLRKHHSLQVVLSNPSPSVMTILERTGVPDSMGREWIFVRVHDAVHYCRTHRLESETVAEDNLDASHHEQ